MKDTCTCYLSGKGKRLLPGLFVTVFWALGLACDRGVDMHSGHEKLGDDFASERQAMVERQIKARGISDERLLNAMLRVPRHEFVPASQVNHAYEDNPLPIGYDQTISQPYIVAYMTNVLELDGSERVLEVGTGSGYQAALLCELADSVFTIEIVEPLCRRARQVLNDQGYSRLQVRCGDGYSGWPEAAPFDAIIITASPPHIPAPLLDQLAPGGIMVLPVGEQYQKLVRIQRQADGSLVRKDLIPVRFVPMTGQVEDE